MKTYTFNFTGRPIGAQGIYWKHRDISVTATDYLDALDRLWNDYEPAVPFDVECTKTVEVKS